MTHENACAICWTIEVERFDRLLEPGRLLGGALVDAMLRERLALDEPKLGAQLGAYRIERELGRGGMGIVYLAKRTDGAYQQDVAIKWLPVGGAAVAATEQFRRERQILAHLRHPHIARLLDGGSSADGHLWFAMEHVNGLPIDTHVAQVRLSWRERVRLLLPVVEAVQYAHARLHIHRDIKPDNVLVDSEGRAVLVDFGIAALLGESNACTAFTERFSSPEQCKGAAPDIRSDIWQLGRLLQVVLEAGTSSPVSPHYPQDLRAIIQQATHTQPEQRYATAAALAVDLQRLLNYQPVAARPPTFWHRLRLFTQAYPLGTALSVVAGLVFIATIAGFMLRLSHQRDLAVQAQETAEAINAFIENDLLPGNDPLQAGSDDLGVAEMAERALLRADTRLHDTPEVAARIQMSLGRTLASLGRFRSAERAFGKAITHYTRLHGALDTRTLRARLLLEQQLLDRQQLTSGEVRLQALRRNILASPAVDDGLLFEIDSQLGHAAFLRDDFTTCVMRYRALLPKMAAVDPVLQSDAYMNLSMCETRLGEHQQALAHASTSYALVSKALGSHHQFAFESQLALETALVGAGRYSEAANVLRPMVSAFEKRYGPDHSVTLLARHDLGFVLTCAGKASEGVTWLQQASAGRANVFGPHHPWYALSESVLGMALIQSGQLPQAEMAIQRARVAMGKRSQDTPYVRVALLENEADLALAQGKPALAMERFAAALAFAETLYPASHQRITILRLGKALAMLDAGQKVEGDELLRASLQQLGNKPDCRQYQVDEARRRLGRDTY